MSKFYNLEGQNVVVEAAMTEIIQEGFIDKIKSIAKKIGQKLGIVKKDFGWTEEQFKEYADACLKDKDFIKEMDETLKTVQYNLNFMAKGIEDDECKLEIKLCSYTQAIRDLEKCENKYAEVKKGPKALTVINRTSSIPEEYYLYPTKFKNYCLLFIGNDVESLEIIVVITQRNKLIKDDVADIYGYSIFAEMTAKSNSRIRELFGVKDFIEKIKK